MSRKGDCYDNAVMESFFSTVKSELGERFGSHGEAKMELFDYIEGGPQRISALRTFDGTKCQVRGRTSGLLAAGVSIVAASGRGGDLAATPQFCGTTSTLQIRKKKP